MSIMMEDYDANVHYELPLEIWERIFSCSVLNEQDLAHLSKACSLFRDIISADRLWKEKYKERWAESFNEIQEMKGNKVLHQWKEIYRLKVSVKKAVKKKLRDLASLVQKGLDIRMKALNEGDFYNFDNLEIEDMDVCDDEYRELVVTLVSCELYDILRTGDANQDLTLRYYAQHSLNYVCRLKLVKVIAKYVEICDESDPEHGPVLIAKWFQPSEKITFSSVTSQYESLARTAREYLYLKSPDHPIFSQEIDTQATTKRSLWSPAHCQEVLASIENVMRDTFDNNTLDYYNHENSFMNKVLEKKTGIPITLSLIVQAIARRLGVCLEPVNFPGHFLLRWLAYPMKGGIRQYSFVDVFNWNYAMPFNELQTAFANGFSSVSEADCKACSQREVVERMARNLYTNAKFRSGDFELLRFSCELHQIFVPRHPETAVYYIEALCHLRVNVPFALSMVQDMMTVFHPRMRSVLDQLQAECQHTLRLVENWRPKAPKAKLRSAHQLVKFSTGMIMNHKKYFYQCVIYGWDPQCMASKEWVQQMGVNRLQRKTHQPFYHVLVNDGSMRYAAEENLLFTRNIQQISHEEVGKYFDSFTGQYYTPNEGLLDTYPEDPEITRDVVETFMNSIDVDKQGDFIATLGHGWQRPSGSSVDP